MNAPLENFQFREFPPFDRHRAWFPVQTVNPISFAGWDELLQTHNDYSFFHTAEWAAVLQKTYGYEPLYFFISDTTHLRALLPVMKIKSWLTGRRGISLPFTDSCVPLNQDLELNDEILPEVLIHGTAAHWRYFECRGGKNFFDGAPASESYYGHELKLQRDVHLLFDRCKSTTRGAVNKALRDGVTVDFSHSEEAMEQFYLLHCRTRRRHGLPPQPPEFFRNIQNYIFDRNMGFVTLATFQKSVIAAAVFFHFGHRAIFKYGASDRSQLHLRGNNLILWETIKWLSENGFESLDFGRTSFADEGLRKFKLGWGTVEKQIDYVRYDFSRREFVTVNDAPHKWRRRFFRALPLALSKSIGTMLYQHAA